MELEAASGNRKITGNTLKMIAIICMLIDHIGAVLIEKGCLNVTTSEELMLVLQTPYGQTWYGIDMVLRTIGRIAFPIFCFLLVEGFLHTRSVKKYAGRLLVFALVSEVPFDLAIFGTWTAFQHQNVFFTLFLGLMVLEGYSQSAGHIIRQILVILSGCAAAAILRCDYDITGIIMITVLYIFWNDKRRQTICGGILSAVESLSCFGAAALAFIPIRMYSGKRGAGNLKYIFYWFYPVHLLVLYLLRIGIFGVN